VEITCTRCHQTVQPEDCFCPSCGLPQLVYTAETTNGQAQTDRWTEAAHDASMVEWKPAMRIAFLLALPTGVLSSALSPIGFFGLFWMAAAAAWAVVLYVRGRGPAWITIGAGARIGFVTGLLAAWLSFSISGGTFFVQRFVLHQAAQIDSEWKSEMELGQQRSQQWTAALAPSDATEADALHSEMRAWYSWTQSPWGHAGLAVLSLAFNSIFFLFFAAGGGALGARVLARTRRQEL